jgi:hypothetical protein
MYGDYERNTDVFLNKNKGIGEFQIYVKFKFIFKLMLGVSRWIRSKNY